MLSELLGKAGKLCQHATEGTIRCPLMIRPTSEDVITGQIMQSLRIINPRWWLPQLLQRAIPAQRFRQQVYRRLQIQLWENRPCLPREYLPNAEGSTQVDAVLRWENPATTVYLEFKYLSPLSSSTSHGTDQDQLLRNIRVGLYECGYYQQRALFAEQQRQFYQIVVSPFSQTELVQYYQQRSNLEQRLTESRHHPKLPSQPFIGEVSYRDIGQILTHAETYLSRPERQLANDLRDYLAYKLRQAQEILMERQQRLRKLESVEKQIIL